ncbi:MAG: cation:proton antiporter [Chloroflexi bacterium]|nr:cation:proton antiporter [Chloroflexota bacterium]MDA1145988.1 cation:proton antiporter [Chloroflexota bacterium]
METAALSALGVIGFAVSVTTMVARRVRLPPILLFLVIGAIAGPSVLHLVDPEELGEIFPVTLEVLVAIIVFEGAFSIDVPYLRRVGSVVRNLLTVGLLITFGLAALLAGLLDVLPWRVAFLFGALVTVTGPTVISPLVRQVRLNDHVRAVLLGEGVLIDPLGAVFSIVTLDIVLSGFEAEPFLFVPTRLLGGAILGLVGALVVRVVLRVNRAPAPAEATLLLLGISVAVYALSEELLHDSGLAAMAVMGVALAARPIPHAEEVRAFEDDLSKLLVGAIYILAVATVDLEVVRGLWPKGFLVIIGLMVVVRPVAVWVSAFRSDLNWRERTYIGLIGPRGVVAAALAAFAGDALGPEQSGDVLAALVFLTVFMTVAVQSTYAGPMADLLGVKAMRAIIAGAGAVSRRVGSKLANDGYQVTLIDQDQEAIARARADGLEVAEGDATDVRTLERLGASEMKIAVGATDSDQVNLLFCQYLRTANPEAEIYARVSQTGAAETFRAAGIQTVSSYEAQAQALLDLIGAPLLTQALAPGSGERTTVSVPVGSGLHGRRVRDLALPQRVLVVLIQRNGEELVPHANSALERGDRMLLFGPAEPVAEAREQLISIE